MIPYLSRDEVRLLYEAGASRLYRKSGRVIARYAEAGETILTIVAGKLETLHAAFFGDVVVRNITVGSAAEQYVMSGESFAKRYRPMPDLVVRLDGFGWIKAEAIGEVRAFVYQGSAARFEAPWGEEMLLEPGDVLASAGGFDIYRIEIEAFVQTYALVEEPEDA